MHDPIEIEVFKNLFHAIAEEMGAALRRTAFSPNIKERRDYSCAVFDARGQVIAMGDHMPVHLGSMPMSVRAAMDALELAPGDVAMLNDPFRGGTHLPDMTLVAPVFIVSNRTRNMSARVEQTFRPALRISKRNRALAPAVTKADFFVASRAHHADVGGAFAGSMGLCREIYQEGVRIPPILLVRAGELQRDALALLLNNVRTPAEREGDLRAQLASCHTGAERLSELCQRYGLPRVSEAAGELLDYSEQLMRAFLAKVPPGIYHAEDFLDDDGITPQPVRIAVAITVKRSRSPRRPTVTVDFTGSSPQVAGSVNAVEAITYSACFYVSRCLLAEDVPATAGLMRPIQVIAPSGSIVNAHPPAAVAGGNVETSQRMVDVLLRALAEALPERVPAASAGSMNNLALGGAGFAYYETLAGGAGAGPHGPGLSAVHTHMTNTMNTPIEALEAYYPLRVRRYAVRRGSGGGGRHRGGDGVVREIELLAPTEVTLLAERRRVPPYGLAGGGAGATGRDWVVRDGRARRIAAKATFAAEPGDRLRIETPGGGGFGRPGRR